MIKFKWETEFKQTEIGEVPGEWGVRKVGDIIKIKYGKGLPSKNRKEGNVPVFGSSGVVGYHNSFVAKGPGLIIGRKGNIGSVYLSKTNFFPIDTVFYAEEVNDAHFMYYLLSQVNLQQLMSDSAVPGLNINFLKNVFIPYPPSPEQSRIATVLSWFDDLIENKKRQNEILEKVAMAIFKSWFVDFEPFKDEKFVYNEELGKEIPKGWEVQGVSAFADISLGGTPKREESKYWNGSIKWATAKDVANTKGIYILETAEYISEEGLNHSNAKILPQDSIIITARGTVGEIRLLGEAISFNQTCYGLIPKNNIGTYYLFLSLKHTLHEIKALSYGTVFDTITMKTFDEMKILVPPPPIIQKFHSLVEPLFQKIILNQKQIMVLRKVRDALLPMLVFGRLRVVEV